MSIEELIEKTNRSKSQTLFLLQLLDNDFDKLVLLESKIKEQYIAYCPSTKEEIEKILTDNR